MCSYVLYMCSYVDFLITQAWFHFSLWFQRRRFKCKTLHKTTMTDGDGCQVMAIPHMTLQIKQT